MKNIVYICLFFISSLQVSCSYSKAFTKKYYSKNEEQLQLINTNFKKLYKGHPFSLELKDKQLQTIGLEIHTDTVRYIYTFQLDEPYLLDTLVKYKLDVKIVSELINAMQKTGCTWVSNIDYYENYEKKYLLFMSVRSKRLEAFLKPEKYYTLIFFEEPQPYDTKGRLIDKADKKNNRRINDQVFHKVTEKVFYAITDNYR